MAYNLEKTAKTVQEAVALALEDLKLDEDKVDVEILDEGNKGIFGFIGNKMARVRVTVRESKGEKAKKFLLELFEKMKVNADIDLSENDDNILLNIKGNDMGVLIGRRGETLDSIQYLSSLVINKDNEDYKRVVVDIENYRMKREETLINLANRLADRVMKYKKNVTLEPMNPYERRVIHSTLQNNKYVKTFSVGDEPNRKVVITLK
ncbi:MAG: RNA-binding cell elongation regulator Jag/EloR [Bacillota bacterium]|nr:RNA-binding cell elongation regulator Jag/EloR [Bacillota bacterium]